MDGLALGAAGLAGNAGGGAVAGLGMGAWALIDDTGWLLASSEEGGG
jgi:hypothetical protein